MAKIIKISTNYLYGEVALKVYGDKIEVLCDGRSVGGLEIVNKKYLKEVAEALLELSKIDYKND